MPVRWGKKEMLSARWGKKEMLPVCWGKTEMLPGRWGNMAKRAVILSQEIGQFAM